MGGADHRTAEEYRAMKTVDRALLGLGVVIPLWLFLGVALTALGYPGYSHLELAMSRLGATGAPTQVYSAWVNNVPLGVFFLLFAMGVARRFRDSRLAWLSAALMAIHGLGSLATGYFPCDQGCAPAQPSTSQHIHNLAGLVMFASLTVSSGLWAFLGKRLLSSPGFGMFSALCVLLSLVTVSMMAKAFADGHLFGLYQRLNYGVSVAWIAVLAVFALRTGTKTLPRPCPAGDRAAG